MKKYIFILVALAFMACEKTIFIGGYAIDFQSGDSIEGLVLGLYAPKPEYSYEDAKWSDLELIAMSTTNSDGFFSMEIDMETDVSQMFYFPLPPTDTLTVNAQYTACGGRNLHDVDYGAIHEFKLERSSSVRVKLINFTQEEIKMSYGDGAVTIHSLNYSTYLYPKTLLPGQKYKFDFYVENAVNNEKQLEYLGSVSRFIKTQLPDDSDKVEWFMPLQVIEIDYNTLDK